MKTTFFTGFLCVILGLTTVAQQVNSRLHIQLSKPVLQPGDSLHVMVDYNDTTGKIFNQSLATMELIIEHEHGQRTRLRWPVINGRASGSLYLSDSLPKGKYTLFAGLQQHFFELVGKIQNDKNIGRVKAMLLTKGGEWDEQEVPVLPDGSFVINNWLFEDNALIAFSSTRNTSDPLNIRVKTQLDSSYRPLAVAGITFYLGNPPSIAGGIISQSVETTASAFADNGLELPAVIVKTTSKTRTQQFEEEYVRGLFRSDNGRTINIMDDPVALGYSNVLSFLQGRVAGLQITSAGLGGGAARWRGSPVSFFLDELRVSSDVIANMPMMDIAIVKAYPPPFFGAPGGNGGAIAIYTRRGGERSYLPQNQQVFRVRGYTPAATVLRMDRMVL